MNQEDQNATLSNSWPNDCTDSAAGDYGNSNKRMRGLSLSSRLSSSLHHSESLSPVFSTVASVPPRYSIYQPRFSRTRDIGSTVYPSVCYAIPDVSCLTPFGSSFKSNVILFIGVDVVQFDEHEPAVRLQRMPSESCDGDKQQGRRSSIIMVENAETQRNDDILSRLDDDDEEENEIMLSRQSVGRSKKAGSDYASIPCSNLRNYLKKEQEVKEVNDRYIEMCDRLRTEKQIHEENEKENEKENGIMNEEGSPIFNDVPIRNSIVPGDMDDIVQHNNLLNSRLSSCDDSLILNSSFDPEYLRSPRLSHVEGIEHIDNINEGNEENISPIYFSFDVNRVMSMLVNDLRNSLSCLPSIDEIDSVCKSVNGLVDDESFFLSLYERYCEINDLMETIDNEQRVMNIAENHMNDAELMFSITTSNQLFRFENEIEAVIDSIRFYASFAKITVTFTSMNDMVFYYHFGNDFVFVRIIYSNGILLRVKGGENVKDRCLLNLLCNLGISKRLHDKQYPCTKIYEFIPDFSFDMLRVYYAWCNK